MLRRLLTLPIGFCRTFKKFTTFEKLLFHQLMRKKKRKAIKYKTVTFKLSAKQMKSLKNYCRARKTTPTKLIKKSIRNYTEHFASEVPEKYQVMHNQLDLFKKDQEAPSMFD